MFKEKKISLHISWEKNLLYWLQSSIKLKLQWQAAAICRDVIYCYIPG